jgi:pyruvate/2-oxoglutarate dehydrogenase complex dihydrolipoamide acyltransferase (E2) component
MKPNYEANWHHILLCQYLEKFVNGEIKIRPMMYLALSYDHRIVDGKEAVTFLVSIKKRLENPTELGLDF